MAFEGEGPRLKVWLKNPHRALVWDPATQVWERCSDDGEFRAASYDGRYVLLQNRAEDWKLHDLWTGATQHLGRGTRRLRFSAGSTYLIEDEALKGEELPLDCRIWSIARGGWSKVLKISQPFTLRIAPDQQSVLEEADGGMIRVMDFNTGKLTFSTRGQLLCFASHSSWIATYEWFESPVVWHDLHSGRILFQMATVSENSVAHVRSLRDQLVLLNWDTAWPGWMADWLNRVGLGLPTHSARCVNLETGQGFAISAKDPPGFVGLIASQHRLWSSLHRLQPMVNASPHFYAQNLTHGGIACYAYALEPGPRWGYLLGVPGALMLSFGAWHLWRRRAASEPPGPNGSGPAA